MLYRVLFYLYSKVYDHISIVWVFCVLDDQNNSLQNHITNNILCRTFFHKLRDTVKAHAILRLIVLSNLQTTLNISLH
jgi:hypothetical protein